MKGNLAKKLLPHEKYPVRCKRCNGWKPQEPQEKHKHRKVKVQTKEYRNKQTNKR